AIADPDVRESAKAHRRLFYHYQNRQMTNFDHHYYRANAERDAKTVQGRKLFFEAEQFRRAAEPDQAMKKYEDAFTLWTEVLKKYNDFRQDGGIQDDIYEYQIHYLDLVQDNRLPNLRPILVAEGLLTQGAAQTQGASTLGLYAGMVYEGIRDPKALRI